ncbi:hypothetical protein AB0953_16600 [Streptomyces sp. NPDC046866]|uniref:hypothetical protein n=1 Tax=Streptomyces sp. NPDC046866 TaxID=3154921 RepID=UPI003452A8CC
MNATITSLAARRRTQTIEDAITSLHASVISDYLTAYLAGSASSMTEIRDEAAHIDNQYPGFPSLVSQLDALHSAA